jgi:hypothetical protein
MERFRDRLADGLILWGNILKLNDVIRKLGVSDRSIIKTGIRKYRKNYETFFDDLLCLSPKDLEAVLNEKYKKIPGDELTLAQAFIRKGLVEGLKRRKQKTG